MVYKKGLHCRLNFFKLFSVLLNMRVWMGGMGWGGQNNLLLNIYLIWTFSQKSAYFRNFWLSH